MNRLSITKEGLEEKQGDVGTGREVGIHQGFGEAGEAGEQGLWSKERGWEEDAEEREVTCRVVARPAIFLSAISTKIVQITLNNMQRPQV